MNQYNVNILISVQGMVILKTQRTNLLIPRPLVECMTMALLGQNWAAWITNWVSVSEASVPKQVSLNCPGRHIQLWIGRCFRIDLCLQETNFSITDMKLYLEANTVFANLNVFLNLPRLAGIVLHRNGNTYALKIPYFISLNPFTGISAK